MPNYGDQGSTSGLIEKLVLWNFVEHVECAINVYKPYA